MGYYINPETGTKEEWLRTHGEVVEGTWPPPPDHTLVCLIGNDGFTAAGIAYDLGERDEFAEPDGRRKMWYSVPTEQILEVCPWVEKRLA